MISRSEFRSEVLRKIAASGQMPSQIGKTLRTFNPELCKQAGFDFPTVALLMALLPPIAAKYVGSATGSLLGSMGSVDPYSRGASVNAVENLIKTYHNASQELQQQNQEAQRTRNQRQADIAHLRR